MPGPLGSSVRIDRLLTDIAIGAVQEDKQFVSSKAAPVLSVSRSSDKYPTWSTADFLRMQTQPVAPDQPSPEASFTMSTDTYDCIRWPLKKIILDEDRDDSDVNLEEATTLFLTQQILLRRDYQLASLLFNSSNWTYYTGAGSGADFVHFSSDSSIPFKVVRTYKRVVQKACGGFMPNTIVVGPEVDDSLKEHPDAEDKIKYTQEGIVQNALLARAFGVKNYLVMDAVYNTAAEGQTASLDNIGGDYMWIGYVADRPSKYNPSAIYTFSQKKYDNAGVGAPVIARWKQNDPDGEWFRATSKFDMKQTSSDAGVLLVNAATG
jgi:hypothetical protein